MPRQGYKSVSLPKGLYNELEEYVKRSNGRYISISEVVREALRDYLQNNTTH